MQHNTNPWRPQSEFLLSALIISNALKNLSLCGGGISIEQIPNCGPNLALYCSKLYGCKLSLKDL